jgi:hypothetical protein
MASQRDRDQADNLARAIHDALRANSRASYQRGQHAAGAPHYPDKAVREADDAIVAMWRIFYDVMSDQTEEF